MKTKFGDEDKKKKKVFISNYTSWLRAGCPISGPVFARGGGWGALRDPMMRILVLAYRFRDEDQKKVFVAKLRLCRDLHPRFCPRTRVYSCLGGGGAQAVFGRGYRTRKALQWHRGCYFVLGHNPRLEGHISRLRGHKQ